MKKFYGLVIMTGLMMFVGMPSAFAQDDGAANGALDGGVFSTSTSTTTTMVVVASPLLTTSSSSNSGNRRPPRRRRRRRRLRRTVVKNTQAFYQSVSVGGGETVQDLASIYAVPKEQVKAFGKHLRQNRAKILKLSNTKSMTADHVAQLDTLLLTFTFAS